VAKAKVAKAKEAKAARALASNPMVKAVERAVLPGLHKSFVLAAVLLVTSLPPFVLAGTALSPAMCLLLVKRSVYSTPPTPIRRRPTPGPLLPTLLLPPNTLCSMPTASVSSSRLLTLLISGLTQR
jgi:hypothetical protein